MKRIVTWVLSIGIFLTCISCASKTEETAKKKKKKAKKTEVSISEVIEDSTTTEEETTTSEETTAETTPIETTVETTVETEPPETTPALKEIPEYVVPSEFQYDDSLEYLNVEYDEVFQQYGVFTDSSDYSAEMVREYLHLFNLDKNAGIDSLIMSVNSTMESAKAACDAEYDNAVKSGSKKTVLFADRFPFRYLVDDYGLDYYAAFVGCSAETEASFETITFLSKKVDELGLSSILTIEGQDKKIADTVKQNTSKKDQEILTMDSLQSTTSKDVEGGVTYLSVMEGNLEVLKEALK